MDQIQIEVHEMRVTLLTIAICASTLGVWAQPPALEGAKFSVTTTENGRATPFSLPVASVPAATTWRADGGNGLDIPMTVAVGRLYGVLPANAPAGSHTFVVHEAKYKGEPTVSITQSGDTAVEVRAGG